MQTWWQDGGGGGAGAEQRAALSGGAAAAAGRSRRSWRGAVHSGRGAETPEEAAERPGQTETQDADPEPPASASFSCFETTFSPEKYKWKNYEYEL